MTAVVASSDIAAVAPFLLLQQRLGVGHISLQNGVVRASNDDLVAVAVDDGTRLWSVR